MIDFLDTLGDKIAELFDEHRIVVIIILGVLIGIIILSLTMSIVQCSSRKIQKAPENFEATDSFVFPENISLVEDYYFSRESKESWTEEESDEWFTEIKDNEVHELSEGNDSIINELLGTAP